MMVGGRERDAWLGGKPDQMTERENGREDESMRKLHLMACVSNRLYIYSCRHELYIHTPDTKIQLSGVRCQYTSHFLIPTLRSGTGAAHFPVYTTPRCRPI